MMKALHSAGRIANPVLRRQLSTAAGTNGLDFVVNKPGIKANLIDGNLLAKRIQRELYDEVCGITAKSQRPPNLTVVLVGDDPASKTYVKRKSKTAIKVGMRGDVLHKPATIGQDELLELIESLNKDDNIDGVLVQLPLPPHIDETLICQSISPFKDVDGFHLLNIGRYVMGRPAFIPATPLGVLEILKRCKVDTFGKTACIVGRSKHIGFTLSTLLHSDGYGTNNPLIGADATTIICHRYTPPDELKRMTLLSDIVITGTGVPGLIRGDMIKEGATVIDIGLIKMKDANGETLIVGDVEFPQVSKVASLITPVPGGVGPMTVAMVLKNTIHAANGIYKELYN
ncbi:PREDICTED: bifunctional methylenetetrahydrofolate dehydrogenase/cyclohydrolase, mitochondrial-like [Amphimedon queenslandica]|uniref:methenyltetrahydrofolate cyclohydrolase n=1 Tax=Amphimedon queenslandica TaxID=400682 RepID=A0A1X7VPP7_AMPQE|nr:PREDICTED: bifunctional methylenetetrahydrofolate dehydrogenase/cyclohydrolase, mitochondrial-like [Amphimedon queenslandica]|eukprot:XP_003383119.1 PREDICTED: bifunctional methylenetetrahydrofolate dehydrogenase/cyclohydrolase, mitochondrial-like [Amphimedon queenslandica]